MFGLLPFVSANYTHSLDRTLFTELLFILTVVLVNLDWTEGQLQAVQIGAAGMCGFQKLYLTDPVHISRCREVLEQTTGVNFVGLWRI